MNYEVNKMNILLFTCIKYLRNFFPRAQTIKKYGTENELKDNVGNIRRHFSFANT